MNINRKYEGVICVGEPFRKDIVRHFKRETLDTKELITNKYLYEIISTAVHTETGEQLIVYKALYSPFETYARPKAMFESEVDREVYPEIKQQYRFEVVDQFDR